MAKQAGKTLVVEQIGSPIRRPADQRATLIGLGLNKMHRRSTLEDTLVDTSQLLANLVAPDMRAGTLADSPVLARMQDYARHGVDININGVRKQTLDYRIYITDRRGIVLFDSSGRDVGHDYSRWNDVYLTLQGKYGARSTRSRPDDEMSTVMHVAAPIRDGNEVIGVLTVAKPNASVQAFVERSQRKILQRGAVLLLLSLLIGLAFAWWLHHALGKLMSYIGDVEAGRKVALPALGSFVITFCIPALLFKSLSQRSIAEVANTSYLLAYAAGSLVTLAAGLLWARAQGQPRDAAAMTGMGMACANTAFIVSDSAS